MPDLPLTSTPCSRRRFLAGFGQGLGALALGELTHGPCPHRLPRAKRVISLFQAGGPSHLETFDPKPELLARRGQPLPDSVRQGQRLTGMSAHQAILPLVGSPFAFTRHPGCGTWVSELLPQTARIADRLCVVRSLYTEAINHDPAITFLQTGATIAGRPSFGAWLSYGLGSDNHDLPTFVVLITKGRVDQPLYARLWGAGFLPTRHQGVQLRAGPEPVLFLRDPVGLDRTMRRQMLDALTKLHQPPHPDASLDEHLAQAELTFRMQASVPDATDLSREPDEVFALYGEDARQPGTFAAHCLLARRLAERGVKFIQLYHQGWDHHDNLPAGIRSQCRDTDRASAALVLDLERRGLLDDTLVVWGGEFGRTCYSQGKLTADNFGRDHHPRCFAVWLAGAGVKAGSVFGETCPFGYNIVRDPVHVHDLHATMLHLLGIDHERLTFSFQGRDYRLTDVHGRVVRGLLA